MVNMMDRSYTVVETTHSVYGLCTAGWFFKVLPGGERVYMLRDARIDGTWIVEGERLRVVGFEVAADGSSTCDRTVSWTTSTVRNCYIEFVYEEA